MGIRDKYGMNETSVVKLKAPDDEPMLGDDGEQCTITVYAPGTAAHNRARARAQNKATDRFTARGKSKVNGDEYAEDRIEFAIAVTKEVSANLAAEFPGLSGRDLFSAI